MRGIGAPIMQFKGFMVQTLEAWYRMAALHGKDGKFSAAASIGILMALSGVWGFPGAEDLRKILEGLYKTLIKEDLDLKTELRSWVARSSSVQYVSDMVEKYAGIDAGDTRYAIAAAVNKGITYPLGLDMTRLGMGNIAPDAASAVFGIPYDLFIGRPVRAIEKGLQGDSVGATAELTPNFIKNLLVAYNWTRDGVRDKYGNRIVTPEQVTSGDAIKKGLGFGSQNISDIRDYEYAQRRLETAVDAKKREYTSRIVKAMWRMENAATDEERQKYQGEMTQVYDEISAHNTKALEDGKPERFIKITGRTIAQRMKRERGGVAVTWGKERKQARGASDAMREDFGLSEEDD
jgi:hypothetical protein